ncbi:T9SS type A sorting domain-containing protein [Candidatus Poribacteria bacterium]|nr:T9SS type A sorting domain-containing protein [Candidatus Poribacteria bacterium]
MKKYYPGARTKIGEIFATTEVENDTTIRAVIPPIPRGVCDVRVINPDTQEAVKPKGFISVREVVYNFPNPFRTSQGTTFRYVTSEPVQSVTVKIFNMAGAPIDVIQQIGNNEVRWQNPDIHVGLYVYVMEIATGDGKIRKFRNVLEVMK